MAVTLLSDVIEPTQFLDYVVERTAEKSAIIQSGIVQRTAEFDEAASGPNRVADMPFWQDISGSDEVISDSADLTPSNITASDDQAAIHLRAKAWGVNDLARILSGTANTPEDALGVIGDRVADYWARTMQTTLVSTLTGTFAAASMSGNLNDIAAEAIASQTDATKLNAETFEDTIQLLGDSKHDLAGIIMHSATEAALAKLDLIVMRPDSEGMSEIPTYRGKRVIVDDNVGSRAGTTDGTVYTTYVFGMGAIGHGLARQMNDPVEGGTPGSTWGVEMARHSLGHISYLANRMRYILHPRGVKFQNASVAAAAPTNAECELAANWLRVFEAKNVKIVRIDHNN